MSAAGAALALAAPRIPGGPAGLAAAAALAVAGYGAPLIGLNALGREDLEIARSLWPGRAAAPVSARGEIQV